MTQAYLNLKMRQPMTEPTAVVTLDVKTESGDGYPEPFNAHKDGAPY